MRRLALRLAIVVASLALCAVATELVLRAVGFSYRIRPERVEFGWPPPVTMEHMYRTDPVLFWVTRDYADKLAGHSPGELDIAFLGDSCTEFGNYPRLLVTALAARYPARTIEVENFGVGGWSSYQGLQQFRRDILPLRPRVATFYFGWNDHWIGFGVEDKELAPPDESAFGWGRLRLSQLVLKARLGYRTRQQGGHRPERVAPPDFRHNLRDFTRLARDNGIVPVLLTAPTSHEPGREPAYLTDRWLRRLEDLVPLHQRYVSIVREVAREEQAVLCDPARDFEAFPRERLAEFFLTDGIHLTPAGEAELARSLLACFERNAELAWMWDDGR